MDKNRAKEIGGKAGLKAVTVGLILAQIGMTLFNFENGIFKAFFWFNETDFLINLIFFVATIYICGYYVGQIASKAILINHKNYNLEGFKFSLVNLVVPALVSSCVSFLIEGTDKVGTQGEQPVREFFLKPMYWICFFGLIPTLIMGFWFGRQIRKRLKFK